MKHTATLTVTSLLSVLILSFHLADDISRGMEPGTLSNFPGVLILAVWLYGTLVLAERRSGYVIMLLGSLLGSGIPVFHMMGAGVARIAKSGGGLFFVWTLLALGATAIVSLILSAYGLWRLRGSRPR